MTEQEAEVMAARLTRIWKQNTNQEARLRLGGDGLNGNIPVQEGVRLLVFSGWWTLDRREKGFMTGSLTFNFETAQIYFPPENNVGEQYALFAQFAQEWMPFFRRNCWLSGCDIEASAHEKAEWMQGFSREEIQQWDLKF